MQAYGKSKLVYIITGITGHLGNTVVRCLRGCGEKIIGLLLPGEKNPFPDVEAVYGDVTEKDSLRELFAYAKDSIVIHCAGKVSISSFDGLEMWNTNVAGTRNMVNLSMEYGVRKFIYVSSVHAIPEKPDGLEISEITDFCPENVVGDYAKTKSAATAYVLEAFQKGLPACVVHPSGIIGPYDPGLGQMSAVLQLYLKKRLPVGVDGGYDFVDVRDVAKGIVSCCENGKAGECYILSGHYYSIKTFLELAAKEVSRQAPRMYEAYADSYFFNANSKQAPQVVDKNVQPILDQSEVYSGCYGRISVNFYGFSTNGNKGIAAGLGNIQKLRDGESLGGRTNAEDDFDAVEVDDEEDFLG